MPVEAPLACPPSDEADEPPPLSPLFLLDDDEDEDDPDDFDLFDFFERSLDANLDGVLVAVAAADDEADNSPFRSSSFPLVDVVVAAVNGPPDPPPPLPLPSIDPVGQLDMLFVVPEDDA